MITSAEKHKYWFYDSADMYYNLSWQAYTRIVFEYHTQSRA